MTQLTKEELLATLRFDGAGMIPVITQCCDTHRVLMLAYANQQAVELTLEQRLAHYWSRSRDSLWLKGDTSGHYQHMREILVDCDGDTLIYIVKQTGVACHTGAETCFYRQVKLFP